MGGSLLAQGCYDSRRPSYDDDRSSPDDDEEDADASSDPADPADPGDDQTQGDDDDGNNGGSGNGGGGSDGGGNSGGGNNGGGNNGGGSSGGGGNTGGSTPSGGPVPPFVDDCGGLNDDFASLSGIESIELQTYSAVQLCAGEEDWYQVNIPAGTWVSVEIDIDGSGNNGSDNSDLDLVEVNPAGDAQWWSASEQGYERLAWYNPTQSAVSRYLMVYGYQSAAADYDIIVRVSAYHQGMDCDTFYPLSSSTSENGECNRIMQAPQNSTVDQGYFVEHQAHYSNLRREVSYLVTWATQMTSAQFPGTNVLSLMDMSERNGDTPGAMVGQLRHPEGTHINGNDIDIAYYQTGPDNAGRVVCAHDDYFCTSPPNILDATRTAYFMVRLMDSPHLRVIGVDTMIATAILAAADSLRSQGVLTQSEVTRLDSYMAYGQGWPFHHHHMHLSWDWEDGYEGREVQDTPIGCIVDAAHDPYALVVQPL